VPGKQWMLQEQEQEQQQEQEHLQRTTQQACSVDVQAARSGDGGALCDTGRGAGTGTLSSTRTDRDPTPITWPPPPSGQPFPPGGQRCTIQSMVPTHAQLMDGRVAGGGMSAAFSTRGKVVVPGQAASRAAAAQAWQALLARLLDDRALLTRGIS
jgi:hypothetical protein